MIFLLAIPNNRAGIVLKPLLYYTYRIRVC